MFKRILIANRGEIASRIIKSARRMGIETVAVYSEADRDALHVEMADSAVAVGPPPAAQSYLVIDKIIAACRESGADAVHPGYGFLSERAAFAAFPRLKSAAGDQFTGSVVLAGLVVERTDFDTQIVALPDQVRALFQFAQTLFRLFTKAFPKLKIGRAHV